MLGVGVDMVEVARIAQILERNGDKFVQRILSLDELDEFAESGKPDNFVAKRFAVKEAVAKALGTGFAKGVSWTDISLLHDEMGKPLADLKGGASEALRSLGGSKVLVSLSDEAGFVIAYAHVC